MSENGNFHVQFRAEAPAKASSPRAFGILFTAVFTIIGLWPLVHGGDIRIWALIAAALFLAAAFLLPRVLSPLLWLWMQLGNVLHKVMNPVMLALMYYLAIVPTGLIMRAFGKRPLRLYYDKAAPSYWILREPPGPAPDTMKNQF